MIGPARPGVGCVTTALSVAGLRARGWEVGVVAPRYPEFPPPGVKVFVDDFGGADHYVPVPSAAFPPYPDIRLAAPAVGRIARAVRELQPDLVHCATEFMIGRLAQVAARWARLPIVTSYHTDFSRYTEAYGAPWLRPAVQGYIARFHGRARRTYTPSDAARTDLLALGARRTAEGLSWERELDRLDASYREVCAAHAGGAERPVGRPVPVPAPARSA